MTAESVSAETILAVLRRLGHGPADERATLGELVAKLDNRGHALVLLLLAAPNLTPGPSIPGFSTIFGVPLAVVACEMIAGRSVLRLPRFLARISIRRQRIASTVLRIEPWLERIERVLKARGPAFDSPAGARALGVACLILALLLCLPIPVFTLLPSIALVIVALGRLARDGIAVICGLGMGVLACGILIGLIVAARHLLFLPLG